MPPAVVSLPQRGLGEPLAASDAVKGRKVMAYYSDVASWCRGARRPRSGGEAISP